MQTQPKLTVHFTLRPADGYDPFAYSWKSVFRWALIVFVCVLMCDLNSNQAAERWGYAMGPAVLTPVVLGVLLLVLFLWPWLRLQWMFRRYAGLGRPRSASFDSDGMHVKSEDSQGDYKWSLFDRIVETRKAFIFAVTSRAATYIPKRCISSAGEIEIPRQLIRENFRGKKRLRTD
jgi:YcxB-like protein